MTLPDTLGIGTVRALYAAREFTPATLIFELMERIGNADPAIFISHADDGFIARAVESLLARAPAPNSLPLWGIPYAIKDNIDVAGMATTCACPAFEYAPEKNAEVVRRLIDAGAIPVGKTNLDQFATGLNGTRSPYGIPRSVFGEDYISGGSSSGSAVAVASGLASFALGTDTAGSGRVPAAFNAIVGIKPTPGLLSTRGVVPACESIDCVSIFSLTTGDGSEVRRIVEGFDHQDAWSRRGKARELPSAGLRVGILAAADRNFHGHASNGALYDAAINRLDATSVVIDYAPFRAVALMLYGSALAAERQAAFRSFELPAGALDPAVAEIFAAADKWSAADCFDAMHLLESLKRQCAAELAKVDVLLLPTAPRIFTVAEMLEQPIERNSVLGTYTNFCNLLSLAAIAVPAGCGVDGLPFGVTLFAPAFTDEALARIAGGLAEGEADRQSAAEAVADESATVLLAVVGAHLSGMPLNEEMQDMDARLLERTRTASDYRLFVLPQAKPPKPGLIHDPGSGGPGIELEIWSVPAIALGRFVERIGSPLGLGKIRLCDGRMVTGFLCESWAVKGAREITSFGGWRAACAAVEFCS